MGFRYLLVNDQIPYILDRIFRDILDSLDCKDKGVWNRNRDDDRREKMGDAWDGLMGDVGDDQMDVNKDLQMDERKELLNLLKDALH